MERVILVVEDQESMRGILADLFRGEGYEVEVASARKSAESLLAQGGFRLAILDYEIPLEDRPTSFASTAQGKAVMEAAERAKVPFVVLTGVAYDWQQAFAARAALDYLDKSDARTFDRLLEIAAQVFANRSGGLPLEVERYQDGNVMRLHKDRLVRVWVTGQQRRYEVVVTEGIERSLYHFAEAQGEDMPCTFPHVPNPDSRRSAARDLRAWLREHFEPSTPTDPKAPVISNNRGGYYCEVTVLNEPDPFEYEERRRGMREAGTEISPEAKSDDGESDGYQRRRPR